MYTVGAIRNADLAKKFYPDFECWFYIHKESVSQDIIDELQKRDNVKIIFKDGDITKVKPRMWRFEPIDDPNVDLMMSRDTDTHILLREKLAVDEWIKSDKIFHIMRDHPWHNVPILAGMFGIKKNNLINIKLLSEQFVQLTQIQYDQDFLRMYVYPFIINSCMIHASFCKYEKFCLPFPIPYDNEYRFVGECIYEDESRNQQHVNQVKRGYI